MSKPSPFGGSAAGARTGLAGAVRSALLSFWPVRSGRRRSSVRITLAGLLTSPVIAVIGLAALNAELNLLYLVFGLGVTAGLANLLLVRLACARLRVERGAPDWAEVGRPAEVLLRVSNPNRMFGAYSLLLEDLPAPLPAAGAPIAFLPFVPARDSATGGYAIIPARRGRMTFREITVRSRFPFGLFQHKLSVPAPGETLVWPALGKLIGGWPLPQTRTLSRNEAVFRRRGGGEDFRALREYLPGDDPRMIHWRTSARLGKPVLRETESSAGGGVWILLDTSGPSAPGDPAWAERFERAVSLAATLAEEGRRRGWLVGLAAWVAAPTPDETDAVATDARQDRSVPLVLPPSSGPGGRRRMMDALALIDSSPDRPGLAELEAELDSARVGGGRVVISLGSPPEQPAPPPPGRFVYWMASPDTDRLFEISGQ